jgi:formylglycine-generating enzyme required for sulfatase activity
MGIGRRVKVAAVALLCAGIACAVRAQELAIQSFNGTGRLTFNTLNSATNYRVEWASSPAGPWKNFIGEDLARLDNIPAAGSGIVTCSVPVFYRVVAAVTNAWMSIDAAGSLDFGAVGVGGTATRTLRIMNRGGAALTVTGIECPDGFSCGWSGVIPAGYQQVVTVTFAPTENADYGGAVTIHSDAGGGNGKLTVSGVGANEYLVIDLSEGSAAADYPVSYLAAAPGGGWPDSYKTAKLVLRRLPASGSVFTMGSPVGELGRLSNETQHEVTFSQDFYVCVFEITQRQWERVTGGWPSYFTNALCSDSRPVEQVSYDDIRGSVAGAGWPVNNGVDAGSFLGLLRARTGLEFDLLTESQWEYACRAGTTTALSSGYNLTSTTSDAYMAEVGRYYYNGGYPFTQSGSTSVGSDKVGSYPPNAWGLYDMQGNIWEWCLDWHGTYPGAVSDPKGASTGTYRVGRGGGWGDSAKDCRSADRGYNRPNLVNHNVGFRIALPAGQ